MTEQTAPKLGQTANDPYAALLGGYAVEVDLLTDEVPLKAWEVTYDKGWMATWGILYLTTHRLVWIRSKIGLPWIAKTVEIPLGSVTGAEARRTWQLWLIPYERGTLVVNGGVGERWDFRPSPLGPGPKEIAGEITNILRERGLLRD